MIQLLSTHRENLPCILVREFLGTLLLVGLGMSPAALLPNPSAIDFAFSFLLAVLCAVFLFGEDLNPAITIGRLTPFQPANHSTFDRLELLGRLGSQMLGGFFGSFLLLISGPTGLIAPVTSTIAAPWAFGSELVYTFGLGLLAYDSRSWPRTASALAIGTYIGMGAYVLGPLTGGSFNPARALGPELAVGTYLSILTPDFFMLYIFAPILGASTAFQISKFLKVQ